MQCKYAWRACACLSLLLACAAGAAAQSSPTQGQRKSDTLATAPLSEGGFSYYTSFMESHDSSAGWTTELNSSLRYDFNRQFAIEAGLPFYLGQPPAVTVAGQTQNPNQTQTQTQQSLNYSSLGNFFIDVQMTRKSQPVNYQTALTLTAPTGSTQQGISTGRATFDWNNHFDHDIWRLTPFVEAGLGNSIGSAGLSPSPGNGAATRRLANLPYTTLGMESHFQLGSSVDLVKGISFDIDAYDISPFGNQKVYSRIVSRNMRTIVAPGRGSHQRTFEVAALLSGPASIAADHGFGGAFSFNPRPRVDVEFGYQRSVNYALNTVSMTLGFRFGHLPPKQAAKQ